MTAAGPSVGQRELADLLAGARRAVALTGAGVSVPSGIPDFRSPGTGLWAGVDPMQVAHIDAFRRDPARFWAFYRERLDRFEAVAPNPAHRALAELEARGLLRAVVTQNIDGLHQRAGSRRVIEVHGTTATLTCTACGRRYRREERDGLFDGAGVARCLGCAAVVKPDTVLFGEMLGPAIDEAADLCGEADLLLCVGSSLAVYPVAGLPELTLRAAGRLAIVTQGETAYDQEAAVRLGGDVAEELTAVVRALP